MTGHAQATLATPPGRDQAPTWYGSASPSVVAVGHSHRAALVHAIQEGRDGGIGAVLMRPDSLPDQLYWNEAARTDPELPIALTYGGNSYNIGFLFEGPRAFTVIHPFEARVEGREIVPMEAVRDRLDTMGGARQTNGLRRVLDQFHGHRCVLLAPPPPKPERLIRDGAQHEPVVMNVMRRYGADAVLITRLSLRRVMREVMFESFATVAAEYGVAVIESAPEAADADGALRPEYSAADATHANGLYGGLVWRQLAQHFGVGAST